jgi:hypothetical protein
VMPEEAAAATAADLAQLWAGALPQAGAAAEVQH